MHDIIVLQERIDELYRLMNKEFSQDWKSYSITIDNKEFEINHESDPALKAIVIKALLKDAVCSYIDNLFQDSCKNDFAIITRILNGARKEDHQFEIYKEEIVTNLDADDNPITAKPLNEDNVLVQWQDQNKFKFEEEDENVRMD